MELHPDLVPLATLVGTWSGEGSGFYPTIAPFSYTETVSFGHVGKPFLAYSQKTAAADDGRPLHSESGYLRLFGDAVEMVIAQPGGVAEVSVGRLVAGVISLASQTIALTPTAKSVTSITREFRLDGDVLSYTLGMAAVGQPLAGHLEGTLHRVA